MPHDDDAEIQGLRMTSIVNTPPDAADRIRAAMGLPRSAPLRIAYLPGPGDVAGTYQHWSEGRHDPRVPIATYSNQFYELAAAINAEALLPTAHLAPATTGPITFQHIKRPPGRGPIGWRLANQRYANALGDAVEAYAPHVVLAHSDAPASLLPRLAKGRKLILSVHNTYWPYLNAPTGLRARLKQAMLAGLMRKIDDAICTSDACQRQVAELTGGRVKGLVSTPQLLQRFEMRRRGRVERLLFIGRIEHAKGVFDLLDALRILRRDYPDLSLVIAGDGSASDALADRLGGGNDPGATFTGRLSAEGIHQAIDAADLVVCPTRTSFHEGLAVVPFEAAAHGAPTLMSTNVPAAEAFGSGGASFRADDTEDLTRTLAALITDQTRFRALCENLTSVVDQLYDRDRSWGSQLFQLLARQTPL